MKFIKNSNFYLIRLFKGEEIISSLIDLCSKESILSGSFTGIGAISKATLSSYQLEKKSYLRKEFEQPLEISNITGNIAKLNNDPIIHCHATLGRNDFSTISGHLDSAFVAATCEISLYTNDIQATRKMDENIGLNLLDIA